MINEELRQFIKLTFLLSIYLFVNRFLNHFYWQSSIQNFIEEHDESLFPNKIEKFHWFWLDVLIFNDLLKLTVLRYHDIG